MDLDLDLVSVVELENESLRTCRQSGRQQPTLDIMPTLPILSVHQPRNKVTDLSISEPTLAIMPILKKICLPYLSYISPPNQEQSNRPVYI